jgi:hypothetical protein
LMEVKLQTCSSSNNILVWVPSKGLANLLRN